MLVLIEPVAKPRQSQRDRWAKRPCVMRYRTYADVLRAEAAAWNLDVSGGTVRMEFGISMPASWSRRKKEAASDTPHRAKPDIDNLVKGVLDALLPDDSIIWRIEAAKFWVIGGYVQITCDHGALP